MLDDTGFMWSYFGSGGYGILRWSYIVCVYRLEVCREVTTGVFIANGAISDTIETLLSL